MTNFFIKIPQSIQISYKNNIVLVKGPFGQEQIYCPFVGVQLKEITSSKIEFVQTHSSLFTKKYNQTAISLIHQSIRGVLTGYRTQLELRGIGYRGELTDQQLMLKLGFSHLIFKTIPKGFKLFCPKPRLILIQGTNTQKINEFRSILQSLRFPEPYKGKGLFTKNQQILRKQGKKS